jgi:uncharacterized iron-regulated protein
LSEKKSKFNPKIDPGMKKHYLLILVPSLALLGFTGHKPAYNLFDGDGKKVKYSAMIRELGEADIIFFGELHTDPIAHWLQLEMTKDLYDMKQDALILGAEMFEADNQLILDEYLAGMYPADKFEAEMKLWGNYQTDYKPLVEFAREHHIPFIATNIPRRYASMVYRKGFEALDSLTAEARGYMAPLPIRYDPEVRCYKEMLNMQDMGKPMPGKVEAPEKAEAMPGKVEAPGKAEAMPGKAEAMPGKAEAMPGKAEAPEKAMDPHGMGMAKPAMENLPKAQAVKDATMAYFIMKNWEKGRTVFHFNGSYHSDHFEGIVWHLRQQERDLKIMTIGTVLQQDIDSLEPENRDLADYILCVPESMTRTNR